MMDDEGRVRMSDQQSQDSRAVGNGVAVTGKGDFLKITGQNYLNFLKILHKSAVFDWYMEVGCRAGRTFGPVRGRTIAVDPFFRITENVINSKPNLFIFQQTSDDFFADDFVGKMGIKLSLSFLDGMHLFEFLLRDFINTEKLSDKNGAIMLHDCCPWNFPMQTRSYENLPDGRPWTGDVWKLIPILQEYRPDLTIEILGSAPSGLVILSGLDPKNTVLTDNYDEIIKQYTDCSMSAFGVSNFFESFEFIDPIAYAKAGYPAFKKVMQSPKSVHDPKRITP